MRLRDKRKGDARAAVLIAGAAVLLALGCSSCAPQKVVDYPAYERMPDSVVSKGLRAVASTTPATKRLVYYGNYGGPGNLGGKPRDEMDELYRRHDIVYYLAGTDDTMRVADDELVAKLETLDTSKLDCHGEKYRQRAIKFFRSPVSHVVGKKISSFFRCEEPEDSPFPNHNAVRVLFSEDHNGMPEVRTGN